PCRKPPRALGASRLTSSFHFSRQRSPFTRQEPLHRTRILPKPRRLRRFSISDARFALFNIKRDIVRELAESGIGELEISDLAALFKLKIAEIVGFEWSVPRSGWPSTAKAEYSSAIS